MGDRGTYLLVSDFDRLEDWCSMVSAIFGPACGPYLVGSATERSDYRDVDIRAILPDQQFDRWFRGRKDSVRFLNRGFSVWAQQETGLPVDFQVQRQTEANEQFSKPRNSMGSRDPNRATSGVPK